MTLSCSHGGVCRCKCEGLGRSRRQDFGSDLDRSEPMDPLSSRKAPLRAGDQYDTHQSHICFLSLTLTLFSYCTWDSGIVRVKKETR